MTGTVNQIMWAEQIREGVGREFERIANALRQVAMRQGNCDREDTHALLAILEEKRRGVMAHDFAGYFIRDWQDLGDRARQMLVSDPRYDTITAKRAARRGMARQRPEGT